MSVRLLSSTASSMFLKMPWVQEVAKWRAVSQAAQFIRKATNGDVMEARNKVEVVGKNSHAMRVVGEMVFIINMAVPVLGSIVFPNASQGAWSKQFQFSPELSDWMGVEMVLRKMLPRIILWIGSVCGGC
eukprot:GFUD01117353.1.p1 GENE.GFUD01117353.1~~GFUD01117353.1.p1  ORF type:complete len:130 (-),score=30.16 GFUD01117353.1:8-397(-)